MKQKESSSKKAHEKKKPEKTSGKKSATSPDKKEDLPGYPHYPAQEDIMSANSGMKKVDTDLDSTSKSKAALAKKSESASPPEEEYDDLGIVDGTEADVTDDDLEILGPKDQDMDMGEDEMIKRPVLDDPDELDVPGAELDDEQEALGEEDEENNYYSLGGERHEDLEQTKG